jgi:hypothetical protein
MRMVSFQFPPLILIELTDDAVYAALLLFSCATSLPELFCDTVMLLRCPS